MSEKFKARGKRKGYTKLLLGRSEIPTLAELTAAEECKTDSEKKVLNSGCQVQLINIESVVANFMSYESCDVERFVTALKTSQNM